MKSLFLVRHAKSSWDNADMSDFDRTLNARGVKDAVEMAGRLAATANPIDVFISSPALRAKTTAETFAEFLQPRHATLFETGLYLAPPTFFVTIISALTNDLSSVAIFAHNPGITEFANSLNTSVKTDNIPTCGVFAVQAEIANWSDFFNAKKLLLFYNYPKLNG